MGILAVILLRGTIPAYVRKRRRNASSARTKWFSPFSQWFAFSII